MNVDGKQRAMVCAETGRENNHGEKIRVRLILSAGRMVRAIAAMVGRLSSSPSENHLNNQLRRRSSKHNLRAVLYSIRGDGYIQKA